MQDEWLARKSCIAGRKIVQEIWKFTALEQENLEARVGFEPTNGGFADLSLRPLGYRAGA